MKNKKAFSFVELIVSISILAIISTIGFISYISYLGDSRDSQRKSDLAQMGSALKVYKQKRGYFPNPGDYFNLTFKGEVVVNQGLFNSNVRLNTIDKLPMDPKTKSPYFYSITKNAQEYELSATLENTDNPIAILNGNYKSVSKNILPTIILAINANQGENIEIHSGTGNGATNRNKFIFNEQEHNLAYTFPIGNIYNDGTTFEQLLSEAEANNKYWQNTDYRSCIEIKESGKNIQTNNEAVEYQIIDDNGTLINRNCTCNTTTCTGD